jgi:hypothetical protein
MRRDTLLRQGSTWALVAISPLLVLLVAEHSVALALALVGGVGALALVAFLVGSRSGMFWIAGLLIATVLLLPADLSLHFRIPLGGGGVFIIDVLLALLLASWFVNALAEGSFRFARSPATLPLALFLCWVAFAGLLGLEHGNDLKYVLQDIRGLAYYVLLLWVLSQVRSRREILLWLKVLAGCLLVGFAIGVYYSVSGRGLALTYVESGVSRFPAPAEVFQVSTALAATYLVIWPRGQHRPLLLWVVLVVSLLAVMLSYVRGFWIGLAVGFVYLLFVLRTPQRFRLVVGTVLLLALVIGGMAAVRPTLVDSLVTRASSATLYGNDPSIQYRLIEDKAVEAQVRQSPILGKGLGAFYLFDFSRYGVAPFEKNYIHNNYLWFAQRVGLVGLALFLWLIAAFLFGGRGAGSIFSAQDPWLGGLVVGSRVVLVTSLVVSMSSPQFNSKGSVAVIAMLMGLAEVAKSLSRQSSGVTQDARGEDPVSVEPSSTLATSSSWRSGARSVPTPHRSGDPRS